MQGAPRGVLVDSCVLSPTLPPSRGCKRSAWYLQSRGCMPACVARSRMALQQQFAACISPIIAYVCTGLHPHPTHVIIPQTPSMLSGRLLLVHKVKRPARREDQNDDTDDCGGDGRSGDRVAKGPMKNVSRTWEVVVSACGVCFGCGCSTRVGGKRSHVGWEGAHSSS